MFFTRSIGINPSNPPLHHRIACGHSRNWFSTTGLIDKLLVGLVSSLRYTLLDMLSDEFIYDPFGCEELAAPTGEMELLYRPVPNLPRSHRNPRSLSDVCWHFSQFE